MILVPDESHLFALSFIPSAEGPAAGHFIIPHNGAGCADTVILTGYGSPWLSLEELTPVRFELGQNYPNPFNPVTVIPISLPKATPVTLTLFNLSGQEAAILYKGELAAGYHQFAFTPQQFHLANGIYFYRLQTSGYNAVKKLVYLK